MSYHRDEILSRISNSKQPAWLSALRREALARFESLGYPSIQQEAWKYTNPKVFADTPFQLTAPEASHAQWKKVLTQPLTQSGLAKNFLTFLNGHLVASQIAPELISQGLYVAGLRETLEKEPERLQKYLTQDLQNLTQPFFAFNKALLQDGAFIEVPARLVLHEPIELRFLSLPEVSYSASHPHNLIVAGEQSQVTILENYQGDSSALDYWTNAATQIIAGENSVVTHYRLQQEAEAGLHLSTLKIAQDCQSQVEAFNFSLGGKLARFEIDSALDAEGASCSLHGLYVAQGTQHVDHQTTIDHLKPHCTSQEIFKGILDDKAQGVFNGSIVVRPGAQKTYSNLINRNLLLSKEALINTKPLLEIFANDVKCSHGATIGRLDETQVFYLRSRGIPEKLARALLTYAFAAEVFSEVKVKSVQERLENFLLGRLHIDAARQEVLV